LIPFVWYAAYPTTTKLSGVAALTANL
jgi:hypothetical protein